jgi:hypothetical protein
MTNKVLDRKIVIIRGFVVYKAYKHKELLVLAIDSDNIKARYSKLICLVSYIF